MSHARCQALDDLNILYLHLYRIPMQEVKYHFIHEETSSQRSWPLVQDFRRDFSDAKAPRER